MHHFFATFTTSNHFSGRKKYVDAYFEDISQFLIHLMKKKYLIV
jgi:hypothetical protein